MAVGVGEQTSLEAIRLTYIGQPAGEPPVRISGGVTVRWTLVELWDGSDETGVDAPWPVRLASLTAVASEPVLAEIWDTPEEDEAWRDL